MSKYKYLTLAMASILFAGAANAEESVNLGKQVVTLDRQGAKVKTNVITTQTKNERTETDLRGLLNEEPAIEFGGGNGTSQYIAIRGMGQNSIDVKVDNAYSDSQILYHQGRFMLDPSLVKIVSVQKGAGSASAGIGATNGAIVAKTLDAQDLLKGSDKNFGVKVNAGYGTNAKAKTYGLSAFGKTDVFDLLISANRVDEENYSLGGNRLADSGEIEKEIKQENGESYDPKQFIYKQTSEVPYSGLDKRGYLAKAGVNLANHRFVVSHMREEHHGARLVREEFALDNSEGSRLTNKRQSPADRKTTISNSNVEWTAKNLGIISEATANAYMMTKERYSADDKNNGYAGNIPGPTTTKIQTQGANLNLDWDAQGLAIVKTGVNYRHQEVKPHFQLTKNDEIVLKRATDTTPEVTGKLGTDLVHPEKTDIGGYVEVIGDIGAVTATAGVRYDYFEFTAMDGKKVSNGAFNPSLGLIWQVTPGLSLNANHNYATRSPRLYDALLAHGKRGITSIADNTKAETARNTEVGFNFNHQLSNNSSIALNGGYFWQKIEDAVVNPQDRHGANAKNATTGVEAAKEIKNIGYITNQGYEVGATYKLGGLTAKFGVSESDPKFHNIGVDSKTVALNPEFAFSIGRTWTGSLSYRFNNPNLEIGVRNRTVERSKASVLAHVSDDRAELREDYSVTDVFANLKPLNNDNLNINFSVNNVTDEYYLPHAQRAGRGLPAAGRDYRFGLNFTF